jgi:hypothetical protein
MPHISRRAWKYLGEGLAIRQAIDQLWPSIEQRIRAQAMAVFAAADSEQSARLIERAIR